MGPQERYLFISHSRQDAELSEKICNLLESQGLSCWIAPRDVRPGFYWDEEILDAIDQSVGLVLVLTKHANASLNVKREIERAASAGKAIFPLCLENIQPSKNLIFYININHRFSLHNSSIVEDIAKFTFIIKKTFLLPVQTPEGDSTAASPNKISPQICSIHYDPFTKGQFMGGASPDPPPVWDYGSLSFALACLELPFLIFPRPKLASKGIRLVQTGQFQLILLQGLPGIGKTVLLSEIARGLERDFTYFLTLRYGGPASIEPFYTLEEINSFLSGLGRGVEKEILCKQDTQGSLRMLIMRMMNLSILLLIDSADQAPQGLIEEMLALLPSAPNVRVLLTCRVRPQSKIQAHILYVNTLSDEETLHYVKMFADTLDIKGDAERMIEHLPPYVSGCPQALSTVLSNLEDLPVDLFRMESLPAEIYAPLEVTKKIFALLTERDLQSLALLTILNRLNFVETLNLLEVDLPKGFLMTIRGLLARSLIMRHEQIYLVPDMVYEALLDFSPSFIHSAADLIYGRLETLSNHIMKEKADKGNALKIGIIAGIVHNIFQSCQFAQVSKLSKEEFLEFLNMGGYWKEYWLLLRLNFEIAGRINDTGLGIRIGFRMVRKSLQMRDTASGRRVLAYLEEVIDNLGASKERANLLSHKALFTELDGDSQGALGELLESRKTWQMLEDEEGLATVDKLMGNIYLRGKDYFKARSFYESAVEFFGKSNAYYKNFIESEISLATCDLAECFYNNAESRLRRAIDYCYDSGYQAGISRAFLNLGMVLYRQGKTKEALKAARAAALNAIKTDRDIVVGAAAIIWKLEHQSQKSLSEETPQEEL
jgi:tetratricopeptide (TPR) repeat protein